MSKHYNYTLTIYARILLQSVVQTHKLQSRNTLWRHQTLYEFDGSVMHEIEHEQESDKGVGVSHLLNTLARNHDISEWSLSETGQHNQYIDPTPNYTFIDATTGQSIPLIHPIMTYPYTLRLPEIDKEYLKELEDHIDPTPWDQLPEYERQARTKLQQQHRKQYEFNLTPYSRDYYAAMQAVYNIGHKNKVPTPNNNNNQTTRVSNTIEAIARSYFDYPEDALTIYANTINPNMSHPLYGKKRPKKRFGNFDGTPWLAPIPGEPTWNYRLSSPKLYTQGDVEFACTHGMRSIAIEAQLLNPNLILPGGKE